MIQHIEVSDESLRKLIRKKKVSFGGNKQLHLYGNLHCRAGKRMKRENRVFFISQEEAITLGYRPCGHCMKSEYQKWKKLPGPDI